MGPFLAEYLGHLCACRWLKLHFLLSGIWWAPLSQTFWPGRLHLHPEWTLITPSLAPLCPASYTWALSTEDSLSLWVLENRSQDNPKSLTSSLISDSDLAHVKSCLSLALATWQSRPHRMHLPSLAVPPEQTIKSPAGINLWSTVRFSFFTFVWQKFFIFPKCSK